MDSAQPKIALVTGATGFVGSHLARRLVRDGWQVHVVVRPDSELAQLREAAGHVTVHRHDGTTQGLIDIVREASPQIVFHLASLFISEHQPADVEPLIRSNLLFGTQLLEAMAVNGTVRLVNAGTSWQHYQGGDYNPVNLYAATKQAFEDILRFYVEARQIRAITLKLFDTYGPDDPRPKLVSLLARFAASGEALDMSPGEQLLDLVYIDDVVEAFVMAGHRTAAGSSPLFESYGVSSGETVTLREFAGIFSELTGKRLDLRWGKRSYRAREVMTPWSGPPLPGWRAAHSLRSGLRLTLRGLQ